MNLKFYYVVFDWNKGSLEESIGPFSGEAIKELYKSFRENDDIKNETTVYNVIQSDNHQSTKDFIKSIAAKVLKLISLGLISQPKFLKSDSPKAAFQETTEAYKGRVSKLVDQARQERQASEDEPPPSPGS